MSKSLRDWTDIDANFTKSLSGEIRIVRNEDAINQSIKIILSTIFGEHVRSDIGSGLFALLFEPMSNDVAEFIQDTVEDNIERFEPRVSLREVVAQPLFESHYYRIYIEYFILPTKRKKTLEYYAPALGVL